jgi:PAT family beta-lactamase induction signal transducer AmpG
LSTPAPAAAAEKPSLLSVLKSPRVWLMLALGFSSGLPLYLVGTTLSAWMTNEGVSLKTIGFFAWASMPYTLKFLWAPFMDRYTLPFLGRRRGWLLVTQLLLAAGFFTMGQVNPKEQLLLMAAVTVVVSFIAASQDIAADAFRTDLLSVEERGFGVGVFTLGYRVGMLAAMALAMILSDLIGWRLTYMTMASLMVVGVTATLLAREPEAIRPPRTLVDAVVNPFVDFFKRGWPAILAIAFILLFRVGDAVAFRMATPYVLKLGFTNTEVGSIQKGVGMLGAIGGALVGGLLVARLGVKKSLALFGTAQAASNLLYVALGSYGASRWFLGLTVGVDNFTGGMGSAAITVFITALCSRSFSATQYALLSSLSAVPMHLLGGFSGILAESLGFANFFIATAFAMVPAIVLLAFMPKDLGVPNMDALSEQATRPTVAPEVAAGVAAAAAHREASAAAARKTAG